MEFRNASRLHDDDDDDDCVVEGSSPQQQRSCQSRTRSLKVAANASPLALATGAVTRRETTISAVNVLYSRLEIIIFIGRFYLESD